MDREHKSGWLLAVMTATLVAMVAFGMIYVNQRAEYFVRQSEQRDCSSLLADIDVYAEAPPATRTGLGQWRSKVERYGQIGCEPPLTPVQLRIPASPSPTR